MVIMQWRVNVFTGRGKCMNPLRDVTTREKVAVN